MVYLDRFAWPHQCPFLAELLSDVFPGFVFLYIVCEFSRYLKTLDELAKRVQYESIAKTYLVGLVLWAFALGFVATEGWNLATESILVLSVLIIEPVRATLLYFSARRYR